VRKAEFEVSKQTWMSDLFVSANGAASTRLLWSGSDFMGIKCGTVIRIYVVLGTMK